MTEELPPVPWRHVVIIPTLASRSSLLARALSSVAAQVRAPDRVLVVLDGDGDLRLPPTDEEPPIEALRNRRACGLSGALNTALDHLLRTEQDPERVLLSFLDDDDWWEPEYLAEVANVRADGVLLVGALVRHDAESPQGRRSSRVRPIDRAGLLVENPGVQGSNLSVVLGDALRAGCFDEGLQSCTDRDFVIRLLDLGLNVVRASSAVAHHDATHGEARLSDPSARAKHRGLDAFYAKYATQTTQEQQRAFAKRASDLFGWSVPESALVMGAPARPGRAANRTSEEAGTVVVGVIVDGDTPQRARGLIADLERFACFPGAAAVELVLLENGSAEGFASCVRAAEEARLRVYPASLADQLALADALGLAAGDVTERKTIAVARTLLHQLVYAVGKGREGAFAWILDDDLRLPDDLGPLVDDLSRLRTSGFDVAIGRTIGAPPIPASAMIRTQLVDLHSLLRSVASGPLDRLVPLGNNAALMHERRDYYHDLARLETDRLEAHFTPPCVAGASAGDALAVLAPLLPRVFAGEAITRPLLDAEGDVIDDATEGHLRGGNTLVFRWDLLRDERNLSPRLRGRPVRRSDMVWACDVHHRRGAIVRMVPFALRQDRSHDSTSADWFASLIDDVLGYAFFRAYEERIGDFEDAPPEAPEARSWMLGRARKLATERFAAVRLSFCRCQGLGQALALATDEVERLHPDIDRETIRAWKALAEQVSARFASARLEELRRRFDVAQREVDYAGFLDARAAWSSDGGAAKSGPCLERWTLRTRIALARKVLRGVGASDAELLGAGAEGVVFRDGERLLKVLDRWSAVDRARHEGVLRALLDAPRCPALPEVRTLSEHDGMLVLGGVFEATVPYGGGDGPALVACLRALRRAGWAHTNVRPENLRLSAAGLQIIDLGRSLRETTPALHDAMIRRAFLSWRFPARSDLDSLRRRSNIDGDFAACVGWEVLRDAVSERDALIETESRVAAWMCEQPEASVLDLGAGKPRELHGPIRARLTAFDPDASLAARWARQMPDVSFSASWPPLRADGAPVFDRVCCARVLCAIDDDQMHEALERIRQSLSPSGEALIVLCDPTARAVAHTSHQQRRRAKGARYGCRHTYTKRIAASRRERVEVHRPLAAYRRALARAGLVIEQEESIGTIDLERLERVGETLLLRVRPLPRLGFRTALVLKACALDAQTAPHQIVHLVTSLGRPRAFDEVVVALDPSEGPFPRAHGEGDLPRLRASLAELQAQGVVDRVVEGPTEASETIALGRRWFGVEATATHAQNGQATSAFLRALDSCSADLVLHSDIDSLVARPAPNADIIAEAAAIFDRDPDAVTLALPVAGATDPEVRAGDERGPFRVETQLGWLHRSRLEQLLPLPNELVAGVLQHAWHRALDRAVQTGRARSLRAGSQAIWYCSPDNARKHDPDRLLLALDRVEQGFCPPIQRGHAAMQGTLASWHETRRTEPLIVVACGRNVGEGRLRRFVDSLLVQSLDSWGLVFVDDASDDGSEEVIDRVLRPIAGRTTVVRRRRRQGALSNIVLATRSLVAHADAVIVLADPDDALGTSDTLERVARAHAEGADVTVGSMVRTDKETSYVVDFDRPRQRRGGNVWQHLRTFRRSLFDGIDDADLRIDGAYVDLASDWSFMLPIVEMAQRPVWLPEALYLHEPSSSRPAEERAVRERNIAQIVARPSYARDATRGGLERLVTVAYHRVLPPDRHDALTAIYASRGLVVRTDTFERQLRRWARAFDPIALEDVAAAIRGERTLPARPLLLTFDDGYRDFAEHALPIAQRLGTPTALFARAPQRDGLPSWAPLDLVYAGLAVLADPPRIDREARARLLGLPVADQLVLAEWSALSVDEKMRAREALYLSEATMRDLGRAGVSIGSHGNAHARWSDQDDAWLEEELRASMASLSSLPHGVPMLSYPDGGHDQRARDAARMAGFCGAFALTSPADAEMLADPFALPRHLVPDDPSWDPPSRPAFARGAR